MSHSMPLHDDGHGDWEPDSSAVDEVPRSRSAAHTAPASPPSARAPQCRGGLAPAVSPGHAYANAPAAVVPRSTSRIFLPLSSVWAGPVAGASISAGLRSFMPRPVAPRRSGFRPMSAMSATSRIIGPTGAGSSSSPGADGAPVPAPSLKPGNSLQRVNPPGPLFLPAGAVSTRHSSGRVAFAFRPLASIDRPSERKLGPQRGRNLAGARRRLSRRR